jgi:hypothetical protein
MPAPAADLAADPDVPGDAVSPEQLHAYCMNAGGYYILRGALTAAEVAAARAAAAETPAGPSSME